MSFGAGGSTSPDWAKAWVMTNMAQFGSKGGSVGCLLLSADEYAALPASPIKSV